MKQKQALRLNIGCGLTAPDGWINIDSSLNAWLAKRPMIKGLLRSTRLLPASTLDIPWPSNITILDITRKLPYPNGSVLHVYSSHLLEHLFRDQAAKLLRECHRVMVPGGIIRIIVPDLREAALKYLESLQHERAAVPAADVFIESLDLAEKTKGSDNFLLRIYRFFVDKNSHKWAYDEHSLKALLEAAGFEDIELRQCGKSLIDDVASLDNPVRFKESVCLEGRKPHLE